MRKSDEDWVKTCMEYIVEGRRPVGRPRRTWLESVEVAGRNEERMICRGSPTLLENGL